MRILIAGVMSFLAISCAHAVPQAGAAKSLEVGDFTASIRSGAFSALADRFSSSAPTIELVHGGESVGQLRALRDKGNIIRSFVFVPSSGKCLAVQKLAQELYADVGGVDGSGYPVSSPYASGMFKGDSKGCVSSMNVIPSTPTAARGGVRAGSLRTLMDALAGTGAVEARVDGPGPIEFADGFKAQWVQAVTGVSPRFDGAFAETPCLAISDVAAKFEAKPLKTVAGAQIYASSSAGRSIKVFPHPRSSQCVGRLVVQR